MRPALRPIDRLNQLKSALNVTVATADRDAALRFAIELLDAIDDHVLTLDVSAPERANRPNTQGARAFPARYQGRCDLCGCSIEIDDMVIKAQSPRRGVDHAACADR